MTSLNTVYNECINKRMENISIIKTARSINGHTIVKKPKYAYAQLHAFTDPWLYSV